MFVLNKLKKNEIVYSQGNALVKLIVLLCCIPFFILYKDNQIYFTISLAAGCLLAITTHKIIVIDGFAREIGFYTVVLGFRFGSGLSFNHFKSLLVKKVKVHDGNGLSESDYKNNEYAYNVLLRANNKSELILKSFIIGQSALLEAEKVSKAISKKIIKNTTTVNLNVLREVAKTSNFDIQKIIEPKLTYFKHLSENGKTKFIDRVKRFVMNKRFDFRDGVEANKESVILIASSAIQLTFGLKYYSLKFFDRVLIYPDIFDAFKGKYRLKGGTFPVGFVALSYKHFISGYESDSDKINLGLHEMAHALKIDLLKETYAPKFERLYKRFLQHGTKEFSQIKKGEDSFLRKYASKNMHEFFAVCVEHFFEQPHNFSVELPEIYEALCDLLNQNPLNINNDYSIK